MEYSVEILCLGNELLIGRTVNTNATTIAKSLTKLGYKVNRIITIRDEEEVAISTIQEILDRNPSILCISGGLGPTHDDIQLQVLGKALQRPLQKNDIALDWIREKYKELNPSREKMALLPRGSKPLRNSVGSAPGVVTEVDQTLIFSMPGVPSEMEAILNQEIIPFLEERYPFEAVIQEFGIDIRGARESDITEITNEVRSKYPNIAFKSHPRKDEMGYYLSLHTYSIAESEVDAQSALLDWIEELDREFDINVIKDMRRVLDETSG